MRAVSRTNHRIAALLLRFAGFLCVAAALACSPWLVGTLDPTPPLEHLTAAALSAARATLVGIGLALIGLAELTARATAPGPLFRLFDRPLAPKLLAAFLAACLPLTIAEIALRPFTIAHLQKKETTLFIRDAELGWRLRPGATAPWGGVQMTINSRGLRGPEISYSRDALKPRLLYLGDSVTVGYGLPEYDQAYPFRVDGLLEKELGLEVETVNAAVNGYSPWQEQIFLEREGLKYQPDLVIVGFVLNDVTEPLGLARFGGTGMGHQLDRSYFSADNWLQHNSALYFLADRLNARLRFGPDVRKGAVAHELVGVEALTKSPESPRVREGWSLALSSLEKIRELCASNRVPLAIVIFPFTFQFENPKALAAPQKKLKSFCEAKGIACLDLLPLIASYLRSEQDSPQALFLDADHLSVRGSRVAARLVVDWLRSEPSLWSHLARSPSGAATGRDARPLRRSPQTGTRRDER